MSWDWVMGLIVDGFMKALPTLLAAVLLAAIVLVLFFAFG